MKPHGPFPEFRGPLLNGRSGAGEEVTETTAGTTAGSTAGTTAANSPIGQSADSPEQRIP